jgi:hypothetical protein
MFKIISFTTELIIILYCHELGFRGVLVKQTMLQQWSDGTSYLHRTNFWKILNYNSDLVTHCHYKAMQSALTVSLELTNRVFSNAHTQLLVAVQE